MYDSRCLEGTRAPTLMVRGHADPYCPAGDLRGYRTFPW